MNFILAYFTHVLASEEKKLIPKELIHRFKLQRNENIITAAIFVVSAVPIFWTILLLGLPLRIILWILVIPATSIANVFKKNPDGLVSSRLISCRIGARE